LTHSWLFRSTNKYARRNLIFIHDEHDRQQTKFWLLNFTECHFPLVVTV